MRENNPLREQPVVQHGWSKEFNGMSKYQNIADIKIYFVVWEGGLFASIRRSRPYSEGNDEPLKGFKQDNEIIRFVLW